MQKELEGGGVSRARERAAAKRPSPGEDDICTKAGKRWEGWAGGNRAWAKAWRQGSL